MKLTVFNTSGTKVTPWDIDEKSLGLVNLALLKQALRVYESNSHQGTSKVKTRGEVVGSTKKIYRQKGTGNARHGARYAPIFVGGGIAHGPSGERAQNLILPKKMRTRALSTSLLLKLQESSLSGVTAIEKLSPKTSVVANLLRAVAGHPEKRVLVVTEGKLDSLYRSLKNIQAVKMKLANLVNAYDLVYFDHIITTKEALDIMLTRALGSKKPSATAKLPTTSTQKKASK